MFVSLFELSSIFFTKFSEDARFIQHNSLYHLCLLGVSRPCVSLPTRLWFAGKPLVALPPREKRSHTVELDKREREVYDKVFEFCRYVARCFAAMVGRAIWVLKSGTVIERLT